VSANVLDVGGISVHFGEREVLRDVNFRIGPGELTGLIGPNGAGKTTLLRVILGLQAPTSGSVLIAGARRSRRGVRRNPVVGYVPQKVVFDPDMPLRARDVVALGIDGHRLGIPFPSRQRTSLTDEMLDVVDASRFANQRMGKLSGGEQQRVLIAHALVSRPKLLLLDEPLANLDIKSEQEIVAVLARIAAARGIAILISAHDMNPLLAAMDHIVYVAGGKAASGTTDEVVRPEVLSNLYGHHVDVLQVHERIIVVAGATPGREHSAVAHGSTA
jgi:zinc/manganese transport system ATP-binding protein